MGVCVAFLMASMFALAPVEAADQVWPGTIRADVDSQCRYVCKTCPEGRSPRYNQCVKTCFDETWPKVQGRCTGPCPGSTRGNKMDGKCMACYMGLLKNWAKTRGPGFCNPQ